MSTATMPYPADLPYPAPPIDPYGAYGGGGYPPVGVGSSPYGPGPGAPPPPLTPGGPVGGPASNPGAPPAFGVDPNIYDPNLANPYVIEAPPSLGTPGAPSTSDIYGAGYKYSPYSGSQAVGPDTSSTSFNPTGNEADVSPGATMQQIYASNRDTINTTGNLIGQEAGNELNYYGQLQGGYTGAENAALNQLAQTPGYTAAQAAAITGDPNAPLQTLRSGVAGEQSAVDQYGRNLSGQLQQTEGWQGSAADQFATGVGGASKGLQTGLNEAQQGFQPLNTAVNNPNLRVSDQDVQNIVTAAGTTVGNQFQTAEDTLERQAAAAGNTSPEALAAMRQQLVTQEGATAGDTMTQAEIAARQYQLGALQQQTGMQATAATTEEAAAQAAAAEGGLANIAAQEQIGANRQNVAGTVSQQALNAANQYGQFDVGQQNTQTGQLYGGQSTAEQLGSQRASQVANQAIAGQGAYRSGVAAAEGAAQTGGATALGAQNTAYGTQTSGAASNAQSEAGYQVNEQNLSLGNKIENAIFDVGTTGVPEDMVAKVAGNGPEMIVSPKTSQLNGMMREHVRYGGSRRKNPDVEFGVAA